MPAANRRPRPEVGPAARYGWIAAALMTAASAALVLALVLAQ